MCSSHDQRYHTSFYNGRLVAGADGQHFEHTACGPQQLLIGVSPHDVNQCLRATAGQDYQLHQETTHNGVCGYGQEYICHIKPVPGCD